MSKAKIGIIGYFGFGNAGDEAMKDILLEQFPGSVANNKKQIEKCDAYIIAGGDLVQEFTGLHLPGLWASLGDEPRYALSMGVRSGWESKKSEALEMLSKFSLVYTREQESCDILCQYMKVSDVMPDLVLLADAEKSDQEYPILFNYTTRPWLSPDGQFDNIVDVIKPRPISLSPYELDMKYTDEVADWKTFISMAKSSAGVIGTRLHAIVISAIAGVPMAGIVYEGKVRKFCERYEIPYFDYGVKNGEEIARGLKPAKIDLANERGKIMTAIDAIKDDLRARGFTIG